jgi:hypothetical protein
MRLTGLFFENLRWRMLLVVVVRGFRGHFEFVIDLIEKFLGLVIVPCLLIFLD